MQTRIRVKDVTIAKCIEKFVSLEKQSPCQLLYVRGCSEVWVEFHEDLYDIVVTIFESYII